MTSNLHFADNAHALLRFRTRGLRPRQAVSVSMVSELIEGFTLQIPRRLQERNFEWRMLVNLDVWLWCDATVPLQYVLKNVEQIAHSRPNLLLVRFIHGQQIHDIEVGCGTHIECKFAREHVFSWTLLNLAGSKLGASLCAAIRKRHLPGSQT